MQQLSYRVGFVELVEVRRGIAHLVDVGLDGVLQIEPIQQAGKFLVEVVHLTRAMFCNAFIQIKELYQIDVGEKRYEKLGLKNPHLVEELADKNWPKSYLFDLFRSIA